MVRSVRVGSSQREFQAFHLLHFDVQMEGWSFLALHSGIIEVGRVDSFCFLLETYLKHL